MICIFLYQSNIYANNFDIRLKNQSSIDIQLSKKINSVCPYYLLIVIMSSFDLINCSIIMNKIRQIYR